MATLEELVVSLVAETSGLRAELDKATKATQASTTKMDKAIQAFSDNSGKNLTVFQTAMATMSGVIGSELVLGAFNKLQGAASFLFQELIVNGVSAASATQAALVRLNTALALSGNYSLEASESFNQLAGEIQNTTGVSDDAVLSNIALLASMTKLDNDGLRQATKAAVDLSAALGIDLESATRLIGKAAEGNTEAFKRYGIEIQKGKTDSESFANTMVALSRFTGSAEGQAKSYSGQLKILSATWEDLTKVTGGALVNNNALIAAMSQLNKIIIGQTDELKKNENGVKILVGEGLILLIDTMAATIEVIDLSVRAFQTLYGVWQVLTVQINAVVYAYTALSEGITAANEYASKSFEDTKNNLMAFGESGDGALTNIREKLNEISGAARIGLEEMKNGFDAMPEPINNAKAALDTLAETEEQRKARLDALKAAQDAHLASLAANYAYENELLALNLESELISREEFNAAKLELMYAQEEAELLALEESFANKFMTEQEYINQKIALNNKYNLAHKKFQNDQTKTELEQQKLREQNMRSTLGTIASLASSSSKELAFIGKAAAISQATIDGFAAVQKALASAPPPFNFALAATVGAATAANISKIAGVGLNKGGTVPGGGANVDSVPAMLTPGELVVDRSTNDKLKAFLDSQTQGASTVIEISLREELVEFIEAKIIERQRTGRSLLQGV